MSVQDEKAPFLTHPWTASLLDQPNTSYRVSNSRDPKSSTEDSLFAEVLKTPRTFRSCISFWPTPSDKDANIPEVSTLIQMGDGMNGHPAILHGGIVATVVDEAMGILQAANFERDQRLIAQRGLRDGEMLPSGAGSFTATLEIKYLKPVRTPGNLVVKAWYTKREGRKEWIRAEIRQSVGKDGVVDAREGDEVVCATGEALFITRRKEKL